MIKLMLALGRWTLDTIRSVGQIAWLFAQCMLLVPLRGVQYRMEIIRQMYFIGVGSIPVILTTGAFAGAVFAYAMYNQLVSLGVESWAGVFMAKLLTWHFGPVLIGLVLAGRVGCTITAEIGTMNVTEQVDALTSFGVSPVAYLVMPRVVGAIVMTPILTVFAIYIGLQAGLFFIVYIMGGESIYQWTQIRELMIPYDYIQGLVKGLVFGIVIALVCCRNGLQTRGGAEGVGLATTSANVSTCVAILIINFLISILLTHAEPIWDAFYFWLGGVLSGVA